MYRIQLLSLIRLSCLLLIFVSSELYATNYYLDYQGGKDENTGLSPEPGDDNSGPWKSFGMINTVSIKGGDSVLFKRGSVWTGGNVNVEGEGTEDEWVVYSTYGSGAKPVFVNGFLNIEGNYIVLENMVSKDSDRNGIARSKGRNIIIRNCEVYNAENNGIRIKGTDFLGYENIRIEGCRVENSGIDNITIHRENEREAGKGFVFVNNVSIGAGEEGFDLTTGSDIYLEGNVTEGNADGSFVCGRGVSDVYITRHFSLNDGTAMKIKSSDRIKIDYSIFTGNQQLISLDRNKTNPGKGAPRNIEILNCVFWQTGSDYIMVARYTEGNIVFRNNIFGSSKNQSLLRFTFNEVENSMQNYSFDFNLYYTDLSEDTRTTFEMGQKPIEFLEWKQEFSQDKNSVYASPLFENASGHFSVPTDFALSLSSPAIDAGTVVGLSEDFNGEGVPKSGVPDIGAVEFDTSSFPVLWSDFAGIPDPINQRVILTWATSQELNNEYFRVERSVDNILFEGIVDVSSQGNSNRIQTYRTYDMFPQEGLNYYRLKQVDLDGTFSYSKILEVLFTPSDYPGIRLYPNILSVDKPITLETPNREGQSILLELVDMAGRSLWKDTRLLELPKSEVYLPQQLKIGHYLLVIRSGQEVWGEKLFIHE